jgi:hypothetical protein
MLRRASAVVLFALAGAALACDDAGHSHKSAMNVDDGVPAPTAAAPAKAVAKEGKTTATPAQPVKADNPAAPKRRTPAGKPLNS